MPDHLPDHQDVQGRSPIWRRAARIAVFGAWVGVVGLGLALLFGLLYRTDPASSGPLETRLVFLSLLIESFAFHAGIGVGVACLGAVALRRRRLGVALALGAGLLLGPVAASHVRPEGPAPGEGDLVVLSANVLYTNEDPSGLIELVREVDPDVVLIQEYRSSWSEAVRRELGEAYPHMVERPMGGAYGEAVLSKRAFVGAPRFGPEGWGWESPMLLVAIEHGGKRVEIGNVHLWAPLSWEAVAEQRRQVAMVGAWAGARMSGEDAPAALVLAGDFNAPYGTNHLRELRAAGLREAHREAGAGRGATWGPRRAPLSWAPGIRLDHVMVMGEAACTGAGVGPAIGSDHRAVWARLRIGE
ncbi:MAG: endonuclease/exonuclease/phosphatase family protein [Phycisphaerales bacterium JB059]